MIIYVAR
jgi:hypothetical protein